MGRLINMHHRLRNMIVAQSSANEGNTEETCNMFGRNEEKENSKFSSRHYVVPKKMLRGGWHKAAVIS